VAEPPAAGLFWVGKEDDEPPGLELGDGREEDDPPPLGDGREEDDPPPLGDGMPEEPPPPEDGGEGIDVPPGEGRVGVEGDRHADITSDAAASATPRMGRRRVSVRLAMVGTPERRPPRESTR
jgi:hypothetical protein